MYSFLGDRENINETLAESLYPFDRERSINEVRGVVDSTVSREEFHLRRGSRQERSPLFKASSKASPLLFERNRPSTFSTR